MQFVSADEVDRVLDYRELTEILRQAFRDGAIQPVRHHHTIDRPPGTSSTLLLMPAWTDFSRSEGHGHIGVKIVTVSPDNNALGKPAVMGLYLLLDGLTGEPQALIDGQRLTQWRTACASALASTYLSREDSQTMLVIGAGALSAFLVRAHAAVRPIRRIRIWNRTPANAEKVAAALTGSGLDAEITEDLDASLGWADIVSAATISSQPLVKGALLREGTHVDLVGAFSPTMRESDDATMERGRVYVDTRAGALKEAGDIVQAIENGTIGPDDILGDLFELTRGEKAGRATDNEITVFKSVGAAIEDLAAGIAIHARTRT